MLRCVFSGNSEVRLTDRGNARVARNNFDLLRLLFAFAVCLVHAYELSRYTGLSVFATLLSSEVAIESFFVVSGFLVFMSYERSSSLSSYFEKRIRRIYPGYIAVVVLCAFGLMFASSRTLQQYFSIETLQYLTANLAFANFLQPDLPGVFEGNRHAAVNGALWTLKIEVMFYLSVPLFVLLFRRFGHLAVIGAAYFASVLYELGFHHLLEQTGRDIYAELGRQLPGQISYFMGGAFLFYYLERFERQAGAFVVFGVLALSINFVYPLPLLEPIGLAIVVVFFGLFGYLGNFGRFGDFSYGVYIVHFPIIQLFVQLGWFAQRPWVFLALILLSTGVCAFLLWHLVEKRFLRRSNHYIKVMQ